MSVTVKCSDLISQFKGLGDEQFSEWVVKAEMVAKIQKIDDLSNFIPLFLSAGALAVYQGLSDEVKGNYQQLKKALNAAFSANSFKAYEMFTRRYLLENESIDVYLAELKRLAELIVSSNSEEWVKCAFISGLPLDLKTHVYSLHGLGEMSLQEVATRTRAVRDCVRTNSMEVKHECLAMRKEPMRKDERGCFECGSVNHWKRFCPKLRMSYGKINQNQLGVRKSENFKGEQC